MEEGTEVKYCSINSIKDFEFHDAQLQLQSFDNVIDFLKAGINIKSFGIEKDVTIQCCLTCKHGNFCPFGNTPGEIFCMKDIQVTTKSNLFFYTVDDRERTSRLRTSTYVCADYQMQTEEYFTYNDYLYYIK